MSQEMYGASGKLGNKVYFKGAKGQTIVREKVTPKNPKTNAQTLQRVLVSQVGLTYKAFKEICDHSFEGYTMGAECANRFKKVNLQYLRDRASEINQAGQSLSNFYNFTKIGSTKFVPGAAIIAQGSLPQIFCDLGTTEESVEVASIDVATNTYQGVCDALRLKRGDQLTFVTVNKVNGEYVVAKARIILDPRNIDGSGAAMSTTFVDASGNVLMPNWKNAGQIYLRHENSKLMFIAEPVSGAVPVAAAVIASRKASDGAWLRSNAQLVISEDRIGSDKCSLLDAVETSYMASEIELENEAYLNNAGVGGTQGSSESQGGMAPITDPVYSPTVSINGVSQSVSGGSVTVDAPLNSIVISGMNLENANCYATKNNGAQIQPVKAAASLTFSGLGAQAGDVVRVYKEGALWFTATAQEAQGGGGGGVDYGNVNITDIMGEPASNGGTANVKENELTILINGTGFGTDSSAWRATKGQNEEAPTSVTDTQIIFDPLSLGTWTLEYNGTGVFTIVITSAED